MYVMILNNRILDFKPWDDGSLTGISLYACYEDLFWCSVTQEQVHIFMCHIDAPSTVVINALTMKICLEIGQCFSSALYSKSEALVSAHIWWQQDHV
jgi:hypothetical protein